MNRNKTLAIIGWSLMAASLMMLSATLYTSSRPGNTDSAARRMERTISRKLKYLDKKAGNIPCGNLPEGMMIYKYTNDTLTYWDNLFPIRNDDIRTDYPIPALTNPRAVKVSPLREAGEEFQLMDMGPRSYLVKMVRSGNDKIIEGLEVERGDNAAYSVRPLSWPGGSAVCINGAPLMKVVHENIIISDSGNPQLMMGILLIFLLSAMFLLATHRTFKWLVSSITLILASTAAIYFWGKEQQFQTGLFSPTLFADGTVLYSIGAILVFNYSLTLIIICFFMMRIPIMKAGANAGRTSLTVQAMALPTITVALFVYICLSFRSLILNSSISLELYKVNEISPYTFLIGGSYLLLMLSIPLLFQLMRPSVNERFRLKYHLDSRKFKVVYSLCCAVFLVITASMTGFGKEENVQEIWAYRLSMERDVMMELHMHSIENRMANDMFIGALAALEGTEQTIVSRIEETYFRNQSQNYNMKVCLLNGGTVSNDISQYAVERMRDGIPIMENSRFVYTTSRNATVKYSAIFSYYVKDAGVSSLMIEITPKTNRQDKGYANILGMSSPGKVSVPPKYSYARYDGKELSFFKGNYAYPTHLNDETGRLIYDSGTSHFKSGGFTHFINKVSDGTVILISRQSIDAFDYLLSVLLIALILYIVMATFSLLKSHRQDVMGNNYYRSTATSVLVISLIATLVVMALVSIIFVYRRNESNLQSLMSEKITTIQTLLAEECRGSGDISDTDNQEFISVMRMVSDMAKTDIALYSTDGKIYKSTIPEIYDMMMVGSRLNQKAYNDILYKNKRYSILKESIGGRKFFAMYAPLFNERGEMMAILGAPYSGTDFDFENEAVIHLLAILIVFVILMLSARFAIESVVDRLFKPLIEMGRKMGAAEVDSLEYIEYGREDEISSLVQSYNRMVHDLSESSKRLAQTERDRAWSDMARQVAHEIKNPLTPMKLQLQRLIRLKERNDPAWQERFDECTRIVLDHIDILTDTANEFSTFAKLYTEEPTLIHLNSLMEEEITMFDNKDDIEIIYAGLDNADIMGPKPQLTRVIVNLITNSIQAIEIARQEGDTRKGRIFVSVRNSSSDDKYYDIVFEDNGPGVSEDNQQKLFTPNFTTKNSGTGLGLAICKSILEKCEATISYSKSFALEGACFTIRYPKPGKAISA